MQFKLVWTKENKKNFNNMQKLATFLYILVTMSENVKYVVFFYKIINSIFWSILSEILLKKSIKCITSPLPVTSQMLLMFQM